ncbi:hypothetical protein IQ07DRAFT_657386, partial [Pyrenochaeta sp. DS3sAY3a]
MNLQVSLLCVEFRDNFPTKQDRKDMVTVLVNDDWLSEKGYRDIYGGERDQFQAHPHPLRMSIEAIFPVWKAGEKFYCHHAENVGLTAEFLNRAKGDNIPVVLAIASEAVNARDMGDLERLELAFDHKYRMRTIPPLAQLDRRKTAARQSKAWWARFIQMAKYGVYDGTRPVDPKFEFRVTSTAVHKSGFAWDFPTIICISKICLEIERSAKYHPKGLRMSRGPSLKGKPGAP